MWHKNLFISGSSEEVFIIDSPRTGPNHSAYYLAFFIVFGSQYKWILRKKEDTFTFSVVTHVKTIISYLRLLFLFQRDTKFYHVTQRVNISQNVRIPSEWQSMHDHEESQLVSMTMYPIIKCWRDLLWMPGDLNQNFSYFWYEMVA
jgi:hypothetical protein